LILKL